jgi:glucose-1-phosphate adenylyltransferase
MLTTELARSTWEMPPPQTAAAKPLVDDTVAVILAGGRGTRLEPLTREICKPALPFGAGYRSIDFSLSNCVNSGVGRVGVATQHKPDALLEHLARVWGNVATEPQHFIAPWRAETRAPGIGYRGTADAIYRNLPNLEQLGPKLVLVLAGDHVYRMDYRPLLAQHCERGAAVTIGCLEVPIDEAAQFGILTAATDGRIDRFVEKPRTRAEIPGGDRGHVLASMGIYVFDAAVLSRALRLDALSATSRHDFGCDVLPRLIRDADACAWTFRAADGVHPAYWRDIGTVEAYWRAHMELLDPARSVQLDDPAWPLPVAGAAPRMVVSDAGKRPGPASRSLIAATCAANGTVERSVIFDGAEIRRGSEIVDAVILPGAVVGAGCRLRGVIVDSGCRVPDGTVIDRSADGKVPTERLKPLVLTGDIADQSVGDLEFAAA